MDREIEHTIEIGKKNKEVIELLTDWCGHLRVEKWEAPGWWKR